MRCCCSGVSGHLTSLTSTSSPQPRMQHLAWVLPAKPGLHLLCVYSVQVCYMYLFPLAGLLSAASLGGQERALEVLQGLSPWEVPGASAKRPA
jgi:hypothetical protein